MPRRHIDPLIQSLIVHLPPRGSVWPPAERKRWLDTMETAFSLIYKDDYDNDKPRNEQ
jgi:hypothetical protein